MRGRGGDDVLSGFTKTVWLSSPPDMFSFANNEVINGATKKAKKEVNLEECQLG